MVAALLRELVFLLFIVAFLGIFIRAVADRRHLRGLQLKATEALKNLRVEASDPKLRLIGATATIERREETGGARGIFDRTADLGVSAYLQNEHGERFLFKWHSKSARGPYVKHLTSAQANATLTSSSRRTKRHEHSDV